MKDSS
jgi:hypothetical protein